MLLAWLEGHWAGLPALDMRRMPGVFLLIDGNKVYHHKLLSDRPDYMGLATAA